MNGQQAELYLERIGLKGPLPPTAETLRLLQPAHLESVPYENMDIFLKRDMSLDEAFLFNKIVINHRGGYCFELNGLFGSLLTALSFEVKHCFARFLKGEPTIPKRRHRVLIVTTPEGERFLMDVGVGLAIPKEPLRLEEGIQGIYELRKDPFFGWMLYDRDRILYTFSEEPQLPVDYEAAHFWCRFAPESPFVPAPMVAIFTRDGRITMDGDILRFHGSEGVREEQCTDRDEALKKYFGIVIG